MQNAPFHCAVYARSEIGRSTGGKDKGRQVLMLRARLRETEGRISSYLIKFKRFQARRCEQRVEPVVQSKVHIQGRERWSARARIPCIHFTPDKHTAGGVN